jgi:uncharacterized membrane protein
MTNSASWVAVTTIAATITTGVMAGIYVAFSSAVMPGLRHTDDRTMVVAMRSINANLQLPWFPPAFGGPVAFGAAALVIAVSSGHAARWWVLGATALYALTLVVTFAVNVPLNRALTRTEPVERARAKFERRWSRWNAIRAVVCAASFAVWLGAVNHL